MDPSQERSVPAPEAQLDRQRAPDGSRAAVEGAFRHSAGLFDVLADGLCLIRPGSGLVEVNPAFCRMTGFSREELVGLSAPFPFWSPEHSESTWACYRRIQTEDFQECEIVFRRKDGSPLPVIIHPAALRDSDGEVEYFVVSIKDARALHSARAEVERLGRLVESAIDQSPAGIVIADAPDGKIRVANRAAVAHSTANEASVLDTPIDGYSREAKCFYPDGTPYAEHDLPLARAIEHGEVAENVEIILQRADGERRWISVNAHPIRNKQGRILGGIAVFPDITDLQRARAELEERLRYEGLVAEVATLLFHSETRPLGERIDEALGKISKSYELDRLALRWGDPSTDTTRIVHSWHRNGSAMPPYPLSLNQIQALRRVAGGDGRIVASSLGDLDHLPDWARRQLEEIGTKSILLLALEVDSDSFGYLHAATEVAERDWREDHVKELNLLGELVAGAYARDRMISALRQSEQRYRTVVDDQTEFIVRWKPDGTRTFVNDAYCRFFGQTREELIGTSFMPLVAAEHRDFVRSKVASITPDSPTATAEHKVVQGDGRVAWNHWTARGIFDRAGNLVELQSVGRDITARKEAEEALRHRVASQSLLADLSSSLLCADAQQVGQPIERALEETLAFYDVDLLEVWTCESGDSWSLEHRCASDRVPLTLREGWPDQFSVSDVPWTSARLLADQAVVIESLDDYPPEAARERELDIQLGIRSLLMVPLRVGGHHVGAFLCSTVDRTRTWPDEVVGELRLTGELIATAMARAEAETDLRLREVELRSALSEVEQLRDRLEAENVYLRKEIRNVQGANRMVGASEALKRCLDRIERVGPTETTVLVLGETGTGKEMVARAIHESSSRADQPFVGVNCAALPPSLIESELFGHEKGAFTGADQRKPGRLELAAGGTLFLDEIGELPPDLQAKFLRVLQEGEYEPLGSTKARQLDARLVLATNRDLVKAVASGEFRADLYYRIHVFPIQLPSLRERREDIPLLAEHFLAKHARKQGRQVSGLSTRMLERLQAHDWPGNIRELENWIERALITSTGAVVDLDRADLVFSGPLVENEAENRGEVRLEEVERRHICHTLEDVDWRIEGAEGAAALLGMPASTLRSRMKRLGIERRR